MQHLYSLVTIYMFGKFFKATISKDLPRKNKNDKLVNLQNTPISLIHFLIKSILFCTPELETPQSPDPNVEAKQTEPAFF